MNYIKVFLFRNKKISFLYKLIFYMLYFMSITQTQGSSPKFFTNTISQVNNFDKHLKMYSNLDISVQNSLKQIDYMQKPNIDKLFPEFPYAYKKVLPSIVLPEYVDDLTKYHGPISKLDIVSRHGYRFPSKYINPENNLKGDITQEGYEQLKQWHNIIKKIQTKHNLNMNDGLSAQNPKSKRLQNSCNTLTGKI